MQALLMLLSSCRDLCSSGNCGARLKLWACGQCPLLRNRTVTRITVLYMFNVEKNKLIFFTDSIFNFRACSFLLDAMTAPSLVWRIYSTV